MSKKDTSILNISEYLSYACTAICNARKFALNVSRNVRWDSDTDAI